MTTWYLVTALLLTVLYTIVTSPELVKRMTRMVNIESPQAMGVWFLGIPNSEMEYSYTYTTDWFMMAFNLNDHPRIQYTYHIL